MADGSVSVPFMPQRSLHVRVLFVTNRWPDARRPSHGIAMFNQAESLRALGIEVDVVPIPGYASRTSHLPAAARVAALHRGRAYDVVHAHHGHPGVVPRLLLRSPLA